MIVVTGAAGFIGSNVMRRLSGRAPLCAVDVLEDAESPETVETRRRELRDLGAREILDRNDLPEWLERKAGEIQALVHLGACSDTTVTDRDYVMQNNYQYTRTLWSWCARNARPFIYASSAATYGDGSAGYDDRADPKSLRPLNLYGESKQRFDLWALEQAAAPPRWVGLKYFNVYGPGERHKGRMASVAFHAFHQARAKGEITLFKSHRPGVGDGEQRRDFVYVEDAVKATLHFLDLPVSPSAPNGLYNVGTGKARTFADLAKAVLAALNLPEKIRYTPMPEDLREKYQYFTQAETAKLRTAGAGADFCSLEEGVGRYVRQLTDSARRGP